MNITPVVFQDGESAFQELSHKYIRHDSGFFILAPSGAGKTYFCRHQTQKHWIDGDDLWIKAGAHPNGSWWKESIDVINRVDQRCDVVTMEAITQGFWIMGASNFWLKPDAIVIPDWETHKKYIIEREGNNYDGGATSEDYTQVQGHIEFIKKWNADYGVPVFASINEAVNSLVN